MALIIALFLSFAPPAVPAGSAPGVVVAAGTAAPPAQPKPPKKPPVARPEDVTWSQIKTRFR